MTAPGTGLGPGPPHPPRPAYEPAFRAPWPVLAIVAAILGGYLLQALSGDPEWVYRQLGFTAADMAMGRWSGLVTALFVHANWAHAIMNAVAALAFGTPVARRFGGRPVGVLTFFAFYLACGILGNLGFMLLRPAGVIIGASGAISGLMGAASRLLGQRGGELAPYLSNSVIGMAIGWIVANLLLAVFGSGLATGGAMTGGVPVAWQAHLFGYAAGLALIGLVAPRLRPA